MDDAARTLLTETVAGIQRGVIATDDDRAAAVALAVDMIEAAEKHGVTYEDFRWVGSIPAECLDVILRRKDRSR